jgi:hypothetical protein
VADLVVLRTTRGLLNLPQYLAISGGVLYFTTRSLESLQQQVMAAASGLPVIDASWFAVEPFLKFYVEAHADLKLVNLEEQFSRLIELVSDDGFHTLLDFFRARGVATEVGSFAPSIIPAIMVYPEDAEFNSLARRTLDSGELPSPIGDLISDYVDKLNTDTEGKLILNVNCSLIHDLAALPQNPSWEAALIILQQMAKLLSGEMLSSEKTTALFAEAGDALRMLVKGRS